MISQYIIDKLSFKEQLLQLMMVDIRYFESKEVEILPKELVNFLGKYNFGGLILFAENVKDKNKTHALVSQIQSMSKISKFIGVDEEGGIVSRLGDGIATVGNMALCAVGDIAFTEDMATNIGYSLAERGINLNFAPVVDINTNPLNPVIGVRSFGSNKYLVSSHAQAYISGLHKTSIISCLKHFPGHGDIVTDTHNVLSILNKSATDIIENELYPYRQLIEKNLVDMVMTAHLVVPQIDDSKLFASKIGKLIDTPVTFSYKLLNDILRKQLGFNGVIISDALDMGAISNNFTMLEASIYALEAGVDILLMPFRLWNRKQLYDFEQYFELLVKHMEQCSELKQKVRDSCHRVLTLKNNYLLSKNDVYALNNIPDDMVKQSVTLFKNETLPWKLNISSKLLAIANNDLILSEVSHLSKDLGYSIDIINYKCDINQTLKILDKYTHILLCSYNLTNKDELLQKIIDKLNQLKLSYILISTCNPYDILYLDNVATNIMIYGISGFDQTNNQIKRFNLNLQTALKLIYTAKSVAEFNFFCPAQIAIDN